MGVVVRRLSILTVAALALSQVNWEGKCMKPDYQMINGLWWIFVAMVWNSGACHRWISC